MAYFAKNDDGAQRGGKLAADIATGLLLATFSIGLTGPRKDPHAET
jgi:hypothetical protein